MPRNKLIRLAVNNERVDGTFKSKMFNIQKLCVVDLNGIFCVSRLAVKMFIKHVRFSNISLSVAFMRFGVTDWVVRINIVT